MACPLGGGSGRAATTPPAQSGRLESLSALGGRSLRSGSTHRAARRIPLPSRLRTLRASIVSSSREAWEDRGSAGASPYHALLHEGERRRTPVRRYDAPVAVWQASATAARWRRKSSRDAAGRTER